ncbi:hypothetical protein V6N12_024383 [Hibiscus sabdariffa]|uniref:Neprosin PEP catalytic domain-containing protein n=1 Tax=Hibiscus sabdariffa TaxID=183260 RepID=A0ABR2G0L9_9ROSI
MAKKMKALELNHPPSSRFRTTDGAATSLAISKSAINVLFIYIHTALQVTVWFLLVQFASVRYGKHNFGAKTRMDVWAPGTLPGQYSMYGIWVASGPFEDLNVIEAGWGGDGHKTTGCFNYLCPGFVQVHREISLGLVLDHISIYNGAQSDIEIGILRVIFSDLLVVKFEVI